MGLSKIKLDRWKIFGSCMYVLRTLWRYYASPGQSPLTWWEDDCDAIGYKGTNLVRIFSFPERIFQAFQLLTEISIRCSFWALRGKIMPIGNLLKMRFSHFTPLWSLTWIAWFRALTLKCAGKQSIFAKVHHSSPESIMKIEGLFLFCKSP